MVAPPLFNPAEIIGLFVPRHVAQATPLIHQAPHLAVAGVTAFAFFGKDEVTVDAGLINSPATLDQLNVGCGLFYYQVPRTEGA
jgi:hypothetical protein